MKQTTFSTVLFLFLSLLIKNDSIHAMEPYQEPIIQLNKSKIIKMISYLCELCNTSFASRQVLTTHMNTHKRYQCNLCDKKFDLKNELTTHQRIHTEENLHTCETCNKYFTRNKDLIVHERIHTGERPYTCNVCDENFIQNVHLESHKKIHTGEKPYTCERCDKSFRQMSNLTIHQRIHTEEKPYTCEKCNKSFSNKSNYNRHIKICKKNISISIEREPHVKKSLKIYKKNDSFLIEREPCVEKPYACDSCDKCFKRIDSLANHISIHTEKNKPPKIIFFQQNFKTISIQGTQRAIPTTHLPFAPLVYSENQRMIEKPKDNLFDILYIQ